MDDADDDDCSNPFHIATFLMPRRFRIAHSTIFYKWPNWREISLQKKGSSRGEEEETSLEDDGGEEDEEEDDQGGGWNETHNTTIK